MRKCLCSEVPRLLNIHQGIFIGRYLRRYFSILARPAMTDSPAERDGCADALASMFFAALTLLLRLLPQSGHLNRILFLSCADASIE